MLSKPDAGQNRSAGINPPIVPKARWRVAAVEALPDYKLKVRFLDGLEGISGHAPADLFAGGRSFRGACAMPRFSRQVYARIWRRHLARRNRSGARCHAPANRSCWKLDAVAPLPARRTSSSVSAPISPRWRTSPARRCGSTLTDLALERARLALDVPSSVRNETESAAHQTAIAEKLIAETGYHRRDGELAELKARLAAA